MSYKHEVTLLVQRRRELHPFNYDDARIQN